MFVFLYVSAGNSVFFSRNYIYGIYSQAHFSVRLTAEDEESDISCFWGSDSVRAQ